jgi:MFS family permease
VSGDAAAPAAHDAYAALRVPAFRWFLASLVAMTLSLQIQGVAVAWQVYAMTSDPLALGFTGLAEALPFLSLVLPMGHYADQHDRKRMALVGLTLMLACAAGLMLLTLDVSEATAVSGRSVRLWSIYAVLALSGVARAVFSPARQALGVMIVPHTLFANAATWRSGVWQMASVVGPAVGGLSFAYLGATRTYVLDVVLLLVALAAFARVRTLDGSTRVTAAPGGVLAGARFVLADRVLFGAMLLDLLAVLFGGATALMPVFVSEVLRVGPAWLGWLRAAPAVGAVVTSLVLAFRPPLQRTGRTLLWAVGVYGACIVAFALSRNPWWSLGVLAVSGAADSISVVVRSTLLQLRTPPEVMGRVMAVNQLFIGSSNEIGAFESGAAARWLGTVPSVVLGGLVTITVAAGTAWRVPALRQLRAITGAPSRRRAE